VAAAAVGRWDVGAAAVIVSCLVAHDSVMFGCSWFKWLHANHPCAASKSWALSQGMEVEGEGEGEGEGAKEEKGGDSVCAVS